ncbi:hypothetical protein F8M41_006945 [Gigaspora margarita]|uniref:Uncharacterized protein n=1 Tax=Gigaspora margarita TaxID=4874 RepID=A0A8H4AWK0_GIGMA|nr:hypothetical protein F8M41_006945 [Gigaspora margarita]
MLNKYNDIECDYCNTNNLECKRALLKTQKAFNKIKDKVFYYCRDESPKEIVELFEFSKYQKLKGFKKNKKDINEYKDDEYEDGIENNDMLLNENKILLEIFKTNKDKISYCKSYETITRIYNDLQKEKKKKKGESGKSDLVQALFEDNLYLKPKKQKMNIFNDTPYRVEQKHKYFEQFLAKYIFITEKKLPNEAYNFGQQHDKEDLTQKIEVSLNVDLII